MHSRIVIARPQGGRGNLAVPGGITGKPRRKRNCLPEIAPQGHFLALRAQGATSAYGLLAMTIRGVHRFNDSLFIPQVHHRARLSAPLQLSARSVALIIHCRSIFFYCCGSFFPT